MNYCFIIIKLYQHFVLDLYEYTNAAIQRRTMLRSDEYTHALRKHAYSNIEEFFHKMMKTFRWKILVVFKFLLKI